MCNFYDFIFNRRGLIVSVFLVFLLTAVLLSCENPNSPSAPVNPDAPVPEVPFEKRTNVTVEGKDCELNIKWDKTENVYYTYVEILDGDKVIFSDVYSPNLKECSIIWLENDKEYTVKVYTQKTEQGTERTEPVILKGKPKKGEKKKSDYLVLMYMDGDNDLHDNLYEDINEVEYGLKLVRKEDGITPLDGYSSVNVIVLWDGWHEAGFKEGEKTLVQFGDANTHIFELASDSWEWWEDGDLLLTSPRFVLSENTKDLTHTSSFIYNAEGEKEVDMGNPDTLKEFIKWTFDHYESDNTIITFSNHGGGPRSNPPMYAKTDDGRWIKVNDSNIRRSMCWDDTSGREAFLKTKDVPAAISEAFTDLGFSDGKKFDLIIEDVCLGGSVEEAYELKDVADYLIASPNLVPGNGLKYFEFISSVAKPGSSWDSIGKEIVQTYKNDYSRDANYWANLVKKDYEKTVEEMYNDSDKPITKDTYNLQNVHAQTITFEDLSKIQTVKEKVDELAVLLNNNKEKVYCKLQPSNVDYTYLDEMKEYVTKFTDLCYKGTFTFLFDLGHVMDRLKACAENTDYGTSWTELSDACKAVQDALSEVIVYSWRDSFRDGINDSQDGLYEKLDTTINQPYYGLTVSGGTLRMIDNAGNIEFLSELYPDFYHTDLAFGNTDGDTNVTWGTLLKLWFSENSGSND